MPRPLCSSRSSSMAAPMLRHTTSSMLSFQKIFLPHRLRCPELLYTVPAVSSRGRRSVPAASMGTPRWGKKVMMSNTELVNEIKEFLSSVGLPEGHVPSTKELSLHGRNDLANVVRRRGYKIIGKLLTCSDRMPVDGSDVQEGLAKKQATPTDEQTNISAEVPVEDYFFKNSNEESGHNGENLSSFKDSSYGQRYAPESIVNADTAVAHSANSNLEENMTKFMEDGYLDPIKDNHSGTYNHTNHEKPHKFVNSDSSDLQTSSPSKVLSVHVYGSVNAPLILQGTTTNQFSSPTNSESFGNGLPLGKGLLDAYNGKTVDTETSKGENQAKINQLKSLLNQKDLELSLLKEQIQKEKHSLSLLQSKAENEIGDSQKLISEKDAELQTAEQSHSRPKEVEIKYRGDGDVVEVAGSFNGWQHIIKMDPQPLASSTDSPGSRKSRLWTIRLWLYPGLNEIKFIIDGHWMVDPEKELTTMGSISNNVLRVES